MYHFDFFSIVSFLNHTSLHMNNMHSMFICALLSIQLEFLVVAAIVTFLPVQKPIKCSIK